MSTTRAALMPLVATARLLSVPSAWLRAEADAGRLPCLRAGPAYLFDVDTVEQLLLERARRSAPAPGGAARRGKRRRKE
jgi:hypothetical protein